MAGADAVAAFLRRMPDVIGRKVGQEIKVQAERLAAAQRAKLQELEKPPEESGSGLASIRVEAGKDAFTQVVLAGGPSTTVGGYDHMLGFEFGTQHQPARSFFYSTARALVPSMRTAIENAAGAAVSSIADDND